MLRQKTLLGETYVELTPGTESAPKLPEGGSLDEGRISETVELDEILRTFDPRTRAAFQEWMQTQAQAIAGHGRDLNDALGNLGPFAEDTAELVDILNRQEPAVQRLIADTGVVFEALTERNGQLRDLIRNSNRAWSAVASRDEELAETFRVLPTFLRESRVTTRRVTEFAERTDPLTTQLRPAARQLSPLLIDADKLAPDLKALFGDLTPLVRVSRKGLPATEQVLENAEPILARIDPFLRQLTPIVDYLGLYDREIAAFFANDSAATQGIDRGIGNSADLIHYLRTSQPLNPEMVAGWPFRLGTNRSNPYTEPGGFDKLRTEGHLEVYGSYLCTSNPTPPPPGPNEFLNETLVAQIREFVFGEPLNLGKAPPCDPQAPLGRLVGQNGLYPRLEPLGE
jgi:phospholipid/cholesterol/gamma-HCH transport system substrate-binding protein